MLASLALSAALLTGSVTTYNYDMQTFNFHGTNWAEASITVDPTGANSFGWLMAYGGAEDFIQVGWWDSAQEGVIPFWENWSHTIYGYQGSSVDIPQSGTINVAIANEINTNVWDLYVQEGPTWVKVSSATTSFSAANVQWKLSTESHNQTPVPSLSFGATFGSGTFAPVLEGQL